MSIAVAWFFARVIAPNDRALDPAHYRLPGTIAIVSSAIRSGGTGEIVYEQAGVRQVSAARAADGAAIPRGSEVVILRCERGVAFVEPWSVFVGERHRDLDAGAGGLDPDRPAEPMHPGRSPAA